MDIRRNFCFRFTYTLARSRASSCQNVRQSLKADRTMLLYYVLERILYSDIKFCNNIENLGLLFLWSKITVKYHNYLDCISNKISICFVQNHDFI